MENPPAAPSAADERVRRLGPLNPLTIAVALVLLAAGGAFGWRMKTSAPSARPTPEVAAAALALEPIDPAALCGGRGMERLREAALRGDAGGQAPLLRDRVPRRSPLPGYGHPSSNGAIEASTEVDAAPGALDVYRAVFQRGDEARYDVLAARYLTRQAAAGVFAGRVVHEVCELGATPFAARGRPGLIAWTNDGGKHVMATWTSDTDVMYVAFDGWADADAALAGVAAVAGDMTLY